MNKWLKGVVAEWDAIAEQGGGGGGDGADPADDGADIEQTDDKGADADKGDDAGGDDADGGDGADGGHGAVLHPREVGDHHAQGHGAGQADQRRLQPLVIDPEKIRDTKPKFRAREHVQNRPTFYIILL